MWDTLTLGQFISLYDVEMNTNFNLIDKQVAMVATLEGKSIESYNKMKYGDLLKIYNEKLSFFNEIPDCKPVDFIVTPKHTYKFCFEINEITAGQYISINIVGNDMVNLNSIAACFMLPMKGKRYMEYGDIPHDLIADDLLNAKFTDIYGCMVFFCPLLEELVLSIVDSSEMEEGVKKSLMHLVRDGVGLVQPKQ